MIEEPITFLAPEVFARLVEQEIRGQCSQQEIAYLQSHPAILEQWRQVLTGMLADLGQVIQLACDELNDLNTVEVAVGTSTHTILVNRRQKLMGWINKSRRRQALIRARLGQINPMIKQANIALTEQRAQHKRESKREELNALSQAAFFSWKLLSLEPPLSGAAHQLLDLTLAAIKRGDEFPDELFNFYRAHFKIVDQSAWELVHD